MALSFTAVGQPLGDSPADSCVVIVAAPSSMMLVSPLDVWKCIILTDAELMAIAGWGARLRVSQLWRAG
jgi:hypothetical protein